MEYLIPASLPAALSLLQKYGEQARVMGGGTGIYELAHRGLLSDTKALVDLSKLRLNYVKMRAGGLEIGASTTFTDLLNTRGWHTPAYGALQDALEAIQPVQVRNAATVAGAICMGFPVFDLPCALVCLDATLDVASKRGLRTVRAEKFLRGYFTLDLRPHELVTAIKLPRYPPGTVSCFEKLSYSADDWAIVNVAVLIQTSRQQIRRARIVLGGGVEGNLQRARKAEERLTRGRPNDTTLAEVADLVSRDSEPRSDGRASADYRRQMFGVLVKRAIRRARKRLR